MEFLPIGSVRLGGRIEEKMQVFFNKRIFSDFAEKHILPEAENALKEQADDNTPIGYWQGEFWGKLMLSACRVQRYTGSAELKEKIRNSVYRVMKFARADGYINSYKDSANVFPPDEETAIKLVGWRCDWNWNIWCRKYTIWGLYETAVLLDDKNILDAAEKNALQLYRELKEKNIKISDTGTRQFLGLPSGSILKPILLIFEKTKNSELLDFAMEIAAEWENGKLPMIKFGLKNTPVHLWREEPRFWAKAYEMMSCLDGIIELYRVTGEEKYLTAVKNIWEQIALHEKDGVFSVGFNDHFAQAELLINSLSEPCDVIHWLRVTGELYRETGDVKYMNAMETTFYNAFMASVTADGKWGARCVRSSGRHFWAEPQCGFKYNHCCVDNMPRGYVNFAETAVCVKDESVYVNHYCLLSARFDGFNIEISDGYLTGGKFIIKIESERDRKVFFRVPPFAGKNAFLGDIKNLRAGEYKEVDIFKGKSEFKVDFDFSLRTLEFDFPVSRELPNDWRTNNWRNEYRPDGLKTMPIDSMVNYSGVRLLYGPILLARSKKVGETDLIAQTCISADDRLQAENIRSDSESILKLDFSNNGKKFSLIDYASADDDMKNEDTDYFNIYF